jgi:hypothetical protein
LLTVFLLLVLLGLALPPPDAGPVVLIAMLAGGMLYAAHRLLRSAAMFRAPPGYRTTPEHSVDPLAPEPAACRAPRSPAPGLGAASVRDREVGAGIRQAKVGEDRLTIFAAQALIMAVMVALILLALEFTIGTGARLLVRYWIFFVAGR